MSVWATRDQPVLQHLADHPPESNMLWTQSRSDHPRPGMPTVSEREFHRSVVTLGDAVYVAHGKPEYEGGGGCAFQDFQVTGAGMQALGVWPLFDALGSPAELAALLDALGRDAATEEERSSFQRAAAAVRSTAPDVVRSAMVGGIGALVRAHLGF